ncbi:hypothetical protein D3C75_1379420 [compost metagenome]
MDEAEQGLRLFIEVFAGNQFLVDKSTVIAVLQRLRAVKWIAVALFCKSSHDGGTDVFGIPPP